MYMSSLTITEKMEKLGKLLAESPLPDEVKKVFVDNASTYTEGAVDLLIETFEKERAEVVAIAEAIAKRDLERQEELHAFEIETRPIVQKAIDETVTKILRESIQKSVV